MKLTKWAEISAADRAGPAQAALIEEHARALRDALTLAELRARRGQTQESLGAALEVSQARVSRIEHQKDVYLSTLEDYVRALGGTLEVTAVFPDETVMLTTGQRS
jgi:hypothetical protein